MDHAFVSRSIWAFDNKLCADAMDVYTSVVVTRSIPCGTSFGPCLLQNTFYDTIAFIAQKSCNKRHKSYVFRVDPEAMRNATLVWSWLRLVQAARSREEQNAEAYLKAGQLYVRATRDIEQEEELLLWYDQELSRLLGFTEMATKEPHEELKCVKCNQVFQHEFPFLAHCRFMCAEVKRDTWHHETCVPKHLERKRQRRVTDFHNIARDLEHKKPSPNEDAEIFPKKRKCEETVYSKGRTSVLLEKTNIANDHNVIPLTREYEQTTLDAPSYIVKLRADMFKTAHLEFKNNAFAEVGRLEGRLTHENQRASEVETYSGRGDSSGALSRSAFSLITSSGQGEQKSAFCKPSKITYNESTLHLSMAQTASATRPDGISDAFSARTGYTTSNLIASNRPMVIGELTGAQNVPTHVAINNAFHYAPEHWSRNVASQLQTSSSLTILPPTFTSFGVSVQNWCAKCNLSFRMTSDLVFHMRSHHKKEFAVESQVRRRREEKLTCPICHEYFRERHHLSRHMTSHN